MTFDYDAIEVDVLASRYLKQSTSTVSTWAVSNTTTEASGESFNNYVATTTDPGMEFFIIALVILFCSIVVIYCLSRRSAKRANESDDEKLTDRATALNPIIIESENTQARALAESKLLSDELSVLSERFVRESQLLFGTVAKYDDETRKIIRLVVPFTFSAIATSSSGLLKLAIISHYVGTDALIAYAMVDGLLGISSSFIGGWVQAVNSVASMAYGAKNYELSGKYVRISCTMYTLCEIPMGIIWIATMGRVVLFMGFDESVAVIAQRYVVVGILINIIGGSIDCFLGFLYLIEKEKFANAMYCASSVIGVGMVFVAANMLDASLVTLGIAMLVNYCLLFFLIVVIPLKKGWFKEFENGLFGRPSSEDSRAAKTLFQVALPLAFGGILANAEWEILTMLAVILGPAEAATWAIMGYIWNVFESTTEAVGNASEIRVAFQLGEGRPDLAKLVTYKSMLIVSIMSIVMSTLLLSLTNVLPYLMTKDATIQDMLAELFPLVALGNVTMSMGMVCWAIVGAQGRYETSTMIATCCAFLITIPVGIITVVMRINLQGLTFAVVIGYTVTAMLLSAVIILSDWEMLAKKIQEQVAAEEEYSYFVSKVDSHAETVPDLEILLEDHLAVLTEDAKELKAAEDAKERKATVAIEVAKKWKAAENAKKLKASEDAKKWNAVFDERSKKTYYYHSETKKATWKKPLGYDEAHGNLPQGSIEAAMVGTPWAESRGVGEHKTPPLLRKEQPWLRVMFGGAKKQSRRPGQCYRVEI